MSTNLPVHLQRRTLPEQLRYLAGKLADGTVSPGIAAMTLEVIADEQEASAPHLAAAERINVTTSAPDCAACNDTGHIQRSRWRQGASGSREYFTATAPCACKGAVAGLLREQP